MTEAYNSVDNFCIPLGVKTDVRALVLETVMGGDGGVDDDDERE